MDRFSLTKTWTAVDLKMAIALALVCAGWAQVVAADNACNRQAVALLQRNSAVGYNTYRSLNDKSAFNFYTQNCADQRQFLDSDLNTAVHEANHMVRSERDAYLMASNEFVPVPPAPKYFRPNVLAAALKQNPKIRNDQYFETYLNGNGEDAASSNVDFTYLLDEMNAYTVDLQTQVDLSKVHPLTHREGGVPAMMTFVAAYASHARDHAPAVWMDLTASPVSPTRLAVAKLWGQSECVLRQACEISPRGVTDEAAYIEALCGASQMGAISIVLGRQARCPKECAGARFKAPAPGPQATEELIEMDADDADTDASR